MEDVYLMDPQPIGIQIKDGDVTTHEWVEQTQAGHDDSGNVVLINIREVASGKLKSFKLLGMYPIGEVSNSRAIEHNDVINYEVKYSP